MERREKKLIAQNRRALHEYDVIETYEAGIQLTGAEVRSLRENNCQLTDCFALVRKGEVWLHNVHIAPYSNGNIANVDPMNRSTPGFPVHHRLPEFTQTHVHRVSDAIQPSHPLMRGFSSCP